MFPQGAPGWGHLPGCGSVPESRDLKGKKKKKQKTTPANLPAAGAVPLSPARIPASAWLLSRKIFLVSPRRGLFIRDFW